MKNRINVFFSINNLLFEVVYVTYKLITILFKMRFVSTLLSGQIHKCIVAPSQEQ
jgi:hypothetical protein